MRIKNKIRGVVAERADRVPPTVQIRVQYETSGLILYLDPAIDHRHDMIWPNRPHRVRWCEYGVLATDEICRCRW